MYKEVNRTLVSNDLQYNQLLFDMRTISEYISIDIETSGDTAKDGLNPWAGYIIGVGFSIAKRVDSLSDDRTVRSYYLPLIVKDGLYDGKTWTTEHLKQLLFAAKTRTWLMFNAKFDMEWMEIATGFRWEVGTFCDPMIEMWLSNSIGVEKFGLKELTKTFFPNEIPPTTFSKLLGVGKKKKKAEEIDVQTLATYCMDDTYNTLRVGEKTRQLMDKEPIEVLKIYVELELPMLRLLADMEMRGVLLDRQRLDKLAIRLYEQMEWCKDTLDSFAEINWNSTQQIAETLEKAGVILPNKYTNTGKQQLTADILESIKDQHSIIGTLLEYRGLKKIIDTYIQAFYMRTDADFRIHAQFRQTGTRTGRLSCGDPNLQNIPTEAKKHMPKSVAEAYSELRALFIAKHKLIQADLSQIEFRLAAHFSKDPVLLHAYKNGADFHEATAKAVTGGDRRLAKNINFGWIFGQRARGLSELTGMPLADAKKFYATFEKNFRRLALWTTTVHARSRTDGYAKTILGRRRYLPHIKSDNFVLRSEAERQAVNTIIQGSAADYLKLAMLRIDRDLRPKGWFIILTVHDEILLDSDREMSQEEIDEAVRIVKYHLENALKLEVPVIAKPMVIDNWKEAK